MTLTSVLLALTSDRTSRTILRNPTLAQLESADSVHVLAFTSHGELLVAESQGNFTIEDWDEAYEVGKHLCCDEIDGDIMQTDTLDEKVGGMDMFLKSALREKVEGDLHWKE
jgi:exosome complex component RRP46